MEEWRLARFWAKVEKTNGCWLWRGAGAPLHGRFKVATGRMDGPHRISYEIHHGPVPDGLCVCHRCDTPACVRPDHLFVGTKGDNNRDRASKGRSAVNKTQSRKTHCPSGHPYDEQNTVWRPNGGRHCRMCRRLQTRESQRRRKARIRGERVAAQEASP